MNKPSSPKVANHFDLSPEIPRNLDLSLALARSSSDMSQSHNLETGWRSYVKPARLDAS
jgi:hypothetical protein